MTLQLSQSALSAHQRCARRFYLRFVRRLEWPAPLTGSEQEWERSLRRGELLHLFIQQHALGIDVEPLVRGAGDDTVAAWWRDLQTHPPPEPEGQVHTEIDLAVPFGEHRLVARFDRLVVHRREGAAALHIVDWKTGGARDAARLAVGWQTTVYRYVAVEAGRALAGEAVKPEHVTFAYWQTDAPQSPVSLTYDAALHEEGRERIARVIERIDAALPEGEDAFRRTEDLDACRHCPYRSYCERGREPPEGLEVDDDFEEPEPDDSSPAVELE